MKGKRHTPDQIIAKLTAADAGFGDLFGYSVALNGDTALVGSHDNNDDGFDSGSAYLFREIGGVWQQVTKLTAPSPVAFEAFGWSVSVTGRTALVGSLNSGSAYVFRLSDCNNNRIPDDCEARGDLDANGIVDLFDHAFFAGCLTGPGLAPPPTCCMSDLDGDSDSDLADFAAMQRLIEPVP